MMLVTLVGSMMVTSISASGSDYEKCAKAVECKARQRNHGPFCCDGHYFLTKCDAKIAAECKYNKKLTCH